MKEANKKEGGGGMSSRASTFAALTLSVVSSVSLVLVNKCGAPRAAQRRAR